MDEKQIRQIIKEEMGNFFDMTNYNFDKNIKIQDYRDIQVGRANGSMFGTETSQKIGFLGKTPVSRQATINDPAGGATQDAEARAAINTLIDRLQVFGFIA